MLYAIIHDESSNTTTLHVYKSYSEMIKNTFSPDSITWWLLDTTRPPKGKTYKVKQDRLRQKAIDYSNVAGMIDNDISLFDFVTISDYFYKYGKRYGLLKEFRQNAIC